MDLLIKNQGVFLALYRCVVGLLFACHGAATLFNVLGGPDGQAPGFGQWPGWWAAVIQLIGGTLVLLGLGARAAAVICSGTMAYAYFMVHQPHALFPIQNGGEKAALFCWGFLLIAVLGPGRWALSTLLTTSRTTKGDMSQAVS
ncbi:DoxX family membrane protein [Nonomuraea phyllanthi]|uniref:DoxX family membrane protein n=1 Tax=Nonomuraea phyllanthi TaxID=2219224 RepID=A0A5C4W262_9ACTN|nr:DoxX family protein [Nonomuraea phyllanthi]KAB8191589.1 DoxX family membrane protein [Nonomuraea phyllanthi]QFY13086.1 DoxX family membrane protein [Nonomuraea phyllanthi]